MSKAGHSLQGHLVAFNKHLMRRCSWSRTLNYKKKPKDSSKRSSYWRSNWKNSNLWFLRFPTCRSIQQHHPTIINMQTALLLATTIQAKPTIASMETGEWGLLLTVAFQETQTSITPIIHSRSRGPRVPSLRRCFPTIRSWCTRCLLRITLCSALPTSTTAVVLRKQWCYQWLTKALCRTVELA